MCGFRGDVISCEAHATRMNKGSMLTPHANIDTRGQLGHDQLSTAAQQAAAAASTAHKRACLLPLAPARRTREMRRRLAPAPATPACGARACQGTGLEAACAIRVGSTCACAGTGAYDPPAHVAGRAAVQFLCRLAGSPRQQPASGRGDPPAAVGRAYGGMAGAHLPGT